MTLTFDKIKDLIGINGTVGVDLLGSARVRDNLFVSGYLTVGGKKFTGLNINGVKAIDKDAKWKGEYIEIEKGGTGQDLSSETGAIKISSGTLTVGTLDIDKGGTGEKEETNWKNSYVTTNADGTLNYDGTDATAPSLPSIGGTLTIDKGGTGATASTVWLNSRVQINTDGTLNYAAGGSGTPTLTTLAGTLTIAKGGTGATASDIWINSRVQINTDGSLNYAAGGSGTPTLTTLGGTLTIAKGGTGATASDIWINSKVTINNDGTLNYDGTTPAAPNLANITGTVTTAKGGTGQDLSSATGMVTVSSGTVAADTTPAVDLTDAGNVPLDQIKSGTTLVKSAVSTSSTWATGDIPSLPTSKITSGTFGDSRIPSLSASKITSGTFADARVASASTWNGKLDSSGTIANNDIAKFDSNGDLAGRSYTEAKTDLSLDSVENKSSSTIRGEIVTGDIPNLAASKITSGALAIARGGTNAGDSNGWLNSRVTVNNDGTLNYDATSAVAPNLANITGTVTVAKGGTGATASTIWLNSRITSSADGTLNYDATSAVAPSLASIPGIVAKAQGGFGADASTVSVGLITDNIEAAGLKSGRAIGDGIESQVIFHDSGVAGTASGDAVATSTIWQEGASADTFVIKIAFNYQHQTESVVMRFVANLRVNNASSTATAKLEVYAMNSGGTIAGGTTGSVLASATATNTNGIVFAMKKSGDADISELIDGSLYRCEISLANDRASGDISYMTGLVVTTAGA